MRRFTSILLFLAVSTCVTCSLITDRLTKDILLPDAELEDNSAPEATPIEVPQPNSFTENAGCAKVGEFVSTINIFPCFVFVEHRESCVQIGCAKDDDDDERCEQGKLV